MVTSGLARVGALVVATVLLARPVYTAVPLAKGMRSFGSVIKAGHLEAGKEQLLFEHTLSASSTTSGFGNGGAVTQQWFAGDTFATNPDNRLFVYLDGETTPSLNVSIMFFCGVGPAEQRVGQGWASETFAHTADAGMYSTLAVPFAKSVRITTLADKATPFWYIVRGVENFPVVVGDLILPPPVRLVQHSLDALTLPVGPDGFFPLANHTVRSGSGGGLIHHTTMLVTSATDTKYQEGCVRVWIDNPTDPMYLASGLEDYFLGAYFHRMAPYHLPLSGFALNATSLEDSNDLMAYRIHVRDPILFSDSVLLQWQGTDNGALNQCPHSFPPEKAGTRASSDKVVAKDAPPHNLTVTVTSNVFVYEYGTPQG